MEFDQRFGSSLSTAPAAVDQSEQQPDSDTEQDARTAVERRRERQPGIRLDCGTSEAVAHRGIVFVHGIGSQAAGETLLDWGGAIIRALLDVRVGHDASADPVIDCQLDPASGESRFIELQLPPVKVGGTLVEEQHWVMTEAWWAQRVRPPSFGQMAEWLGPSGAIRRIVMAMIPRAAPLDPRLRPYVVRYPLRRSRAGVVEESADYGPPEGESSPPNERLRELFRYPAGFYFQAVSALVLLLYGVLRSVEKLIPIGPLRDGALTRPIDRFMLDWFGDVFVLLGDPAQAASVRGRLVDAIRDLNAAGCEEVTVVAHSGGAIVTFMTLADDATRHLKVTRLVTLGEGLNLAWRLAAGEDAAPGDAGQDRGARTRYGRLYENLLGKRDRLEWHDFWASKDPAPVGVLKVPSPAPGEPAENPAQLGRIHSHAVWNRLSLREDHGAYWDNDEEFLLPMLRLLEHRPAATALFGSEEDDKVRSNHRRRRLSILAFWRQMTMLAPLAAVMGAYLTGSSFLERAGDALAGAWARVPGSEAVRGPLDAVRELQLHQPEIGGFLAEAGVWTIAVGLFGATLYSLIPAPERPLPWAVMLDWRRLIGAFMKLAPVVTAAVLGAFALAAAVRFLAGSTTAAIDAGAGLLRVAGLIIGIGVVWLFVRRPLGRAAARRGPGRIAMDAWDFGTTIAVVGLAAVLVAAPFVALVLFPETGRLVLGIAGVVAMFQVVTRVGIWRWNAWDVRERAAARTRREYPGVERVLVQAGILGLTLAALVVGVALNTDGALLVAVALVTATVLLGVSVDVVDAARSEQQTPADTLLRHARAGRAA